MSLADYNPTLEDDLSDLLSGEFDETPIVEFHNNLPAKRRPGRPRRQQPVHHSLDPANPVLANLRDVLGDSEPLPSANQWDPRLILDLALGIEDTRQVLERYGLTDNDYIVLCGSRVFRQELAVTIRDVHENGLPFRAKARVQAEAYLEVINDLVYNETTPATTKLEAIRSTVRWANLEPKEDKSESGNTQAQINVSINF